MRTGLAGADGVMLDLARAVDLQGRDGVMASTSTPCPLR